MPRDLKSANDQPPDASRPLWAPDGFDLTFVPDEVRHAVAEIVQPTYEKLVLDADDPLEKTLGVTVSHLLWLEVLQQADIKRQYTKITAFLKLPEDHYSAIDQHLRIIAAKVKLGQLLIKLRDQRRQSRQDPPPPAAPLPHADPPSRAALAASQHVSPGPKRRDPGDQNPPAPPRNKPCHTEKRDRGDQNPPAQSRSKPRHTEKPDLADQNPSGGKNSAPSQGEAADTEKLQPADQKDLDRLYRAESFLLQHPKLFRTQGSVAATWRTYRGRRLGPYYQLVYRRDGRKRTIYLGRSLDIADRVRRILHHFQARHRGRRLTKRLTAQVRSSLRLWKKRLQDLLAPWGVTLKNFEFRGVRRAFATARQSRVSHANSQPSSITPSAAPFPLRL